MSSVIGTRDIFNSINMENNATNHTSHNGCITDSQSMKKSNSEPNEIYNKFFNDIQYKVYDQYGLPIEAAPQENNK